MQEQFGYSLIASALGIIIVFTILILLSGLMILIRKLSDSDTNEKTKTSSASPAPVKAAPTSQLPLPVLVAAATADYSDSSNWLIAAVAAFFASGEDDSVAPRATSWISTPGKYDPWVANNKLSKTVPGV